MIESILAASGASVVVIAPHPDDESIATGSLIQLAHALGARVTVVLLTDGDNNPWPQRAVERRIWIGARERERWGRRRRDEARSALAILRVPEASSRHLGFPDLGLTGRLIADTAGAVASLCEIFRETDTTIVALPSLSDRHPDHSAAHVMCCIALATCGSSARSLSYMVHGKTIAFATECVVGAHAREQKVRAVSVHHTQLVLSRKRLMAHAERPERFVIDATAAGEMISPRERLPWRISRLSAALADVVLVANNRAWRVAIEHADSAARDTGSPRCVRDDDGQLWLQIPEQLRLSSPAFAKLGGRVASPWIYDRWGWTRLSAAGCGARFALPPHS